jgi:chorismate mutase/prephenate dehydratase
MANNLAQLRTQIDALDLQLLSLLNQRASLAHEVGEIKRVDGSPIFRPERETQVIHTLQASNPGPLKNSSVTVIWREIMSACRALEAAQRIAYLGPTGTFTEQAALHYFGSSIEHVPCSSIDEVFRATAAGSAEFGVVPIENSSEGVISRSLDLLMASPLHIVGETSLLIRHNLLRLTPSMEGIEVVYAHPQALAQCQDWLTTHLPKAERRAASSNAEGARLAATNPPGPVLPANALAVSLACTWLACHSGRRVQPHTICHHLPAANHGLHHRRPVNDCTSLIVSVPNKPGAVHDLLVPLKAHGVSMTRFESRPARSGQWEYYFYIDMAGPPVAAHMSRWR